jgi:rod shape determining protein RodA
LLGAAAIVALPVGLVALQPDLGGALMFVPMVAGMALVAGLRARLLIAGGLLLLVLGAGIWTFGMREYQRARVLTFLSPDSDPLGSGYQLRQSKIAVGSGGLLGKGYRQGTQSQLRFLPARHTDFVFAVLAEEWGFLGVTAVLGLFVLYLWTGLRVALAARDRPGVLLSSGILFALAVHVLYNTAMVIGLVPVTGIPLPFLSYGGSFTLFCFFVTGMLVGVDLRRYVNR